MLNIKIIKCIKKGDYFSTFEILINDEPFEVKYSADPELKEAGFGIQIYWPKINKWLESDSYYRNAFGMEEKKVDEEITKAIKAFEFKKTLNPSTAKTFSELIDEL